MADILHKPTLDDKPFIDRLTAEYNCAASAQAFNSIYLWREAMGLSLLIREDFFTVKCGQRGENSWFFPCGKDSEIKKFINEHKLEKNFELCYADKKAVEFLDKGFPDMFVFNRALGDDEYLYDIEGHISLKGKHYANVRTRYNRALREHSFKTEIISPQNIDDVMEILKCWNENRAYDFDFFAMEKEAFENTDKLKLYGIIVYMDGIPYGAAGGYALSEDTFDMFFSKERFDDPGAPYYTKRELFKSLQGKYKYINAEEDLGIIGLRNIKTLLYPIHKNEMYTVAVK